MRTAIGLLFSCSLVGCAPQVLLPPPPPEPHMPALDAEPPESYEGGMARVMIETDVPARVDTEAPAVLCASTPCAVTLPYGDHVLRFAGISDSERSTSVVVRVAHPTEVVNHTLGRHHVPASVGVGAGVAATGLLLIALAIVLALPRDDGTPSKVDPASSAGFATVGALTLLYGGIIMGASPVTKQDGSTTQWSPPGRAIGGGYGLRF
jgi:hypothetical protein